MATASPTISDTSLLGTSAAPPAPVKTKAPVQKKAAADVTAVAPPAAPAPAPAAPAAPQTSSEVLRSLTSGKITGLPTELSLGYNQYADILARQSEAKAKTKQLEDQQTQDILAGKASVLEESNQKARELYAQAQKDRWTEPAFSFEPHSLFNMAKMFSVLSTLGVMSGGKGKLSAQQTLAAMTGMLKGQRANDEAEYKRQYQAYETNIAAIRAHNEDVRKDVEDMISLLSTDREAASLKKELAIRKEGSGSILASYLDAGNYEAALKLLDSRNNLLADVYKQEQAASVKWEQLRYQRQTAENVARIRAAATGTSRDAYGFGDIVATASNEAAASLQNLVMMPANVSTGIFQGKELNSLFGAPVNVLANTLTSESVQRYNTEVNNLGKFIAQVQKGGRVVTNEDIQQTSSAFKIKEGDKGLTALTKLAQARQALERAIDVRLQSPRTPDSLKEVYRQNKITIKNAVPFTVADINKIATQKDKKQTFSQSFQKMGLGETSGIKSYDTEAEAQAAYDSGELEIGDDVIVAGQEGIWE